MNGVIILIAKRSLILMFIMTTAVTIGCHPQVNPPSPTLTCAVATDSSYKALNGTAPTAADTYTDVTAAGSARCYTAQTNLPVNGVSQPSNVVGPIVVPAGFQVNLSWPAPSCAGAPGTCAYTFTVYSAPAVNGALPPPVQLNQPTTAPQGSARFVVASPITLTARLERIPRK